MKSVLGFLMVAMLAIALALLLGSNEANLTLFWHPYRVDVSFNLAVLLLLGLFVALHAAWRAWGALRRLPRQAQRWRSEQLERTAQSAVLEALVQQRAGRYVRAQAAAKQALAQLEQLGPQSFPGHERVRWLAWQLAAESAHQLGNVAERDTWLQQAAADPGLSNHSEARAGLALQAAAWALEQRDPSAAAQWLSDLPQGVLRRIHALRLRLRLARLRQQHTEAIELVRLLSKHRAYSAQAARSVLRGLVQDAWRTAPDRVVVEQVWRGLQASERAMPELALTALEHWCRLPCTDVDDTDAAGRKKIPHWPEEALYVVWGAYAQLDQALRYRLMLVFEQVMPHLGSDWLAKMEQAQQRQPADVVLQYLTGQMCRQHRLWGKSQSLLGAASLQLTEPELARRCWRSLAELAEQRGDHLAAQSAWKKAALF